jgi:hypothetical protein
MKYYSPYKDNPYGNLKGDKKDFLFQVMIQEAKVIKTENGFVFYGKIQGLIGVQPAFGTSLPKDLGYVEIPVYFDDYTIKQSAGKKDNDGKWIYDEFKFRASAFEKYLVGQIKDNVEKWQCDGKSLKGTITFLPDMQFEILNNDERHVSFIRSVSMELVSESGTLPAYQLKENGNGNKNKYYPKGVTLEEKTAFLKKELGALGGLSEDEIATSSIGTLVSVAIAICQELKVPPDVYFGLLGRIIS